MTALAQLVYSEVLKVRTTRTWKVFLASLLAANLIPMINWMVTAYAELDRARDAGRPISDVRMDYWIAELYTSGQFLGVLFVLLLSLLIVTNEYHHQTATATFLTTPRRTLVIAAKFVTAGMVGAFAWLASTLLNLVAVSLFFSAQQVGGRVEPPAVARAVLLNLLVYVLWAVIGVGVGVLIPNQSVAVALATVVYAVGTPIAGNLLRLAYQLWTYDWVLQAGVFVPSLASQHLLTGMDFPGDVELWPRWTGGVVLLGWAVAAGLAGTLITRRRDIA